MPDAIRTDTRLSLRVSFDIVGVPPPQINLSAAPHGSVFENERLDSRVVGDA